MCAPAEPAVRPKVLVVDDMALNRKLLTAVCRKLGYETVEAVNGAHAVEVFTREGSLVACILLDLEMPVLDGWQAAQKLRDLEGSLAEVPIIACTACNLSELMPQGNLSVEQHTLACGINLCLNKPLSLTCLTAALEQLSVPTPARN
eukprot:GHRR01001578.1.p1 GENE.GHRR01001578.1~~GHRR01001578.1.p1  ORF type:complete len:147 (+),score=34.88 GHRR01001578.1:155-595(+)